MSNYNGQLVFYSSWLAKIASNYDTSGDTFKCILCSSSYVPSVAHTILTDITNELSGNGYARQTMTNVSFETVNGLLNLDADDIIFSAVGGSLVPKYWVVYDDTTATDEIVAYGLINIANTSVTIADGENITLNFGAIGATLDLDEDDVLAFALAF